MSTKILRVFWSVVACPLLLLVSALPAFARGCDALDDGTHCYVTAQQVPPTRPHGVGGLFTEPDDLVVSPPDYSIAQLILVDAADSGKSIEFGWVVDPKRYNNATPHLFIALRHWHKIGTAFSSVRCVLGNPDPTPACVNNKYVPLSKPLSLVLQ